MLLWCTLTSCNGFCFSCVTAVNGRGWRASSLDPWHRFRCCILPASIFYFINRKAEKSTLQGVQTCTTREKVLQFLSYSPWAAEPPDPPRNPSALMFSAQGSPAVPGNGTASASHPGSEGRDLPSGSLTSSKPWVCPKSPAVVAF